MFSSGSRPEADFAHIEFSSEGATEEGFSDYGLTRKNHLSDRDAPKRPNPNRPTSYSNRVLGVLIADLYRDHTGIPFVLLPTPTLPTPNFPRLDVESDQLDGRTGRLETQALKPETLNFNPPPQMP